jgi:hypothetical protein
LLIQPIAVDPDPNHNSISNRFKIIERLNPFLVDPDKKFTATAGAGTRKIQGSDLFSPLSETVPAARPVSNVSNQHEVKEVKTILLLPLSYSY